MKITNKLLKQIIKEELEDVLKENDAYKADQLLNRDYAGSVLGSVDNPYDDEYGSYDDPESESGFSQQGDDLNTLIWTLQNAEEFLDNPLKAAINTEFMKDLADRIADAIMYLSSEQGQNNHAIRNKKALGHYLARMQMMTAEFLSDETIAGTSGDINPEYTGD